MQNSHTAVGRKSLTISAATWYKDAVIYQLHVKSFFDSNNDGIGDFTGLIQKLDYITTLGVNTIWLLPFYPSPLRDDGYDIAEYCAVHPDYGTMEDVKTFIATAHAHGLRVITELVINHTSDQHFWFRRARVAAPGSVERNFYVWSDNDTRYPETRIIFLDTEKSNWAWDPAAQAYYWHRFYSHQPDLNYDNPAVLDSVIEVMSYWLDLGVDGLRLDAVPYLVERDGTNNENLPETHEVLKKIRAVVDARYPDRLLLAEANQWPEDTRPYFGAGDECQMAFHFPLMPRMYMALAQEDRFPVTDILRQTPDIPDICQWAIFLRNHDELTLEMVTSQERDYLWHQYASDTRARLNLGIRRRLAPLMQRDRRRIELMHSLLLSMIGTPILYYGDEINMGDNIFLGDRDGVRTPMQWTPDRNGGFSKADPARLVLPVIMDPLYGYSAVNVEAHTHDSHSFLNWVRLMLEIRKRYKAFGRGTLKMIYPTNRCVLAYIREYLAGDDTEHSEAILCLANMSRAAQAVELDLSAFSGLVPLEMTGGSLFPPIGELPYLLTLPPYGFYWFLLAEETRFPDWYTQPPEPMPDYVTLVLRRDMSEVLRDPHKTTLERDVLPAYLGKRRWFGGKDANIEWINIGNAITLPGALQALGDSQQSGTPGADCGINDEPVYITELVVKTEKETQKYQLALGIYFEEEHFPALAHQLALARVRHRHHIGFITDAVSLEQMTRCYLGLMGQAVSKPDNCLVVSDPGAGIGQLAFHATDGFAEERFRPGDVEIRMLSGEQSNSSLIIGEQAVLKSFRRLFEGPNPEVEIGRILSNHGFTNTGTLLGYVSRISPGGETCVLAVLKRFIPSQGNGWDWTMSRLDRFFAEPANTVVPHDSGWDEWAFSETSIIEEVSRFASATGKRLAQMHIALASETRDPHFAPRHATDSDARYFSGSIKDQIDGSLSQLERAMNKLSPEDRTLAQKLIGLRSMIHSTVESLAQQIPGSLLIRIHGDLHLGQILVAQDDAYFIDFEGEPIKPLAERNAKASPFCDVAGVLRSFDYVTEVHPGRGIVHGEKEVEAKRKFLERFFKAVGDAFQQAYYPAANALDHHWLSAQGPQTLTKLFLLEKAAFEVCYESANRPGWIHIPLRGLVRTIESCGLELGP
ncbi:MAG: maltose alpha-D-glucosyltransferase [Pseudohongiellaceae bacterium]